MDPDQVKAALEALKSGDAQAALTILEALIVSMATDEASEDSGVADPAVDALAADPEPPPAKLAALSALRDLTGCASLGEAVVVLGAWKASHETKAKQAAALDESARVIMVGELVKLGAETPATAWTEIDGKKAMANRLLVEPIADMRTRLVSLRAASAGRAPAEPPARPGAPVADGIQPGGKLVILSDGRQVAITAAEILGCKNKNISHEDFAARKVAAVKRA